MLATQEGHVRAARDPADGRLVRENEDQQGLSNGRVVCFTIKLVMCN